MANDPKAGHGEVDPVCGMPVRPGQAQTVAHEGRVFSFCSDLCRREFLGRPERYAPEEIAGREASLADRRIAYFSMEVALDARIPTYSGGLGVLAGDALRSAADLQLPMVGVSLLYKRGYFDQELDERGNQRELPVAWEPFHLMRLLPVSIVVELHGRSVAVRAWEHDVQGVAGHVVPVILLDTDTEPNLPEDRELTAFLYGGDERYRLCQEAVLGIGGVRMLRVLGCDRLERFHLNEGHAALLSLELLREGRARDPQDWDFAGARERSVFTTHTPVPAGHDQFPYSLVRAVLGEPLPFEVLSMLGGRERLNMTLLAMNLSHYLNGVAKRHGEVSQEMFPGYPIDSITNGVHSVTWTCEAFRRLFDRHIPGWAKDPSSLCHAVHVPGEEVWRAHVEAKARLLDEVRKRTGRALDPDALTVGFARRATPYKRAALVFRDPARLVEVAKRVGSLQFVFAGKAHPRDEPGKHLIRRIHEVAARLRGEIEVVYMEDYGLELAKVLTSGVDLWLNTPIRPLEASGTSGMKAAHNGVPSLSVLDGWWVEGHIEGVTGWSVGAAAAALEPVGDADEADARDLYGKLGDAIAPLFYRDREGWIGVMRQAIAFNASFFNTHRMVQQYAASAYL